MTRRTLTIGVLAAMLVLAGCTATPGTTGTAANETPETASAGGAPQRIQVGATGQVQTTPDRAVVEVAVEVRAADAATARRRLAENVSRIRAALKEMGIDEGQIRTQYFDIDRDRRFREPPRKGEEEPTVTFRGRHALTITLNDLNRTGEVIVTAVENGATSVGDVRFTISQRTRSDLRQRALRRAMQSARRQAETIAAASASMDAGSLVVREVRTSDVRIDRDREVALAATATPSGAGGAPTIIERGQVTVTARVVVAYNTTG